MPATKPSTSKKKSASAVDIDALTALLRQTHAELTKAKRKSGKTASSVARAPKGARSRGADEPSSALVQLFAHSAEAMLVSDPDGLIALANEAAETQFSAPVGGLTGQNIGRLLGEAALQVVCGNQAPSQRPELSGIAFDGRVFPVEFSCSHVERGDHGRRLWIVRDISKRIRGQREIMEGRTRFQDFTEASSDCFWEMDESLSQVEIRNFADSEIVPRLPLLLTPGPGGGVPAGVAEEAWRNLRQHLSARQPFRLRLDLIEPGGERSYVAVSGKPVLDQDGKFYGYRGTARDITREVTAREAARRAERRLIEAMDAAPCAAALLDSQLHLVSGNSALRALALTAGLPLPLDQPFAAFLGSELAVGNISAEVLRRLAATGTVREIAIGKSWYLMAASDLSEGGLILTLSEVTTLKAREGELAEAKINAESASRLKSQFLATMSHELRTPLNAILGFSEVIRDSVFGQSEEALRKYREYAGLIHMSGGHLLGLISEILDLSKIEAGSYVLDRRTVDLGRLLEGALVIVSPMALKAGVEIISRIPRQAIMVEADERALRQIAINLLSNAIKFTPRRGNVTIEMTLSGPKVEISFRDTGIGIAEEHIGAVFDLFRQVDSSMQRRHEGTGLGLAITKRLVELHGGTIALESELGMGTTARVSLPRQMMEDGFATPRGVSAA